jgi:DNA anti-recombination protein RmuC
MKKIYNIKDMTVEAITEILESELKDAVEVKNEKSLHRYVMLLSENIVSKRKHSEEYHSLKSDIKEMLVFIRERFEVVDKRFEQTDKRFESMQNTMDKRFEDMHKYTEKRFADMQKYTDKRFEDMQNNINKRFSQMFAYFTTGFIIMASLMTVYQLL